MVKRKSLAFVLALVMVLTLIPASAFASTSNSVSKVPTVATDTPMPVTTLSFKVDPNDFSSTGQTIKLSLTNATWLNDDTTNGVKPGMISSTASNGAVDLVKDKINILVDTKAKGAGSTITIAGIHVASVTSKTAEFTMDFSKAGAAALPLADDVITLQLLLKSSSDEGEVKVKVDSMDSEFTGGTYTVAVVGSDKTTATVLDDPSSVGRGAGTGSDIEIRENSLGAISSTDDQHLKFTLPYGVNWSGITKDSFSGTLGTVVDGDTGFQMSDRDLYVTLSSITASPDSRRVLVFNPSFTVSKDAKYGDITVSVKNETSKNKGISNASGLVVAKYAEDAVKVSTVADGDLPEIIAGRVDDENKLEITVEELSDSALIGGKYIDFEFPDYVQIIAADTKDSVFKNGQDGDIQVTAKGSCPLNDQTFTNSTALTTDKTGSIDNPTGNVSKDRSSFEYTLPTDLKDNKTDKFTFKIPVTVEADAPAGDLKVKVSGAKAGLSDTELVVGKIVAPVSIETPVADIRAGVQNQTLNDITIKENVAGAFMTDNIGKTINVWLPDIVGTFKEGGTKVEVTSGDLTIDKVSYNQGLWNDKNVPYLTIKLNGESTKPSEIKISGLTLSVDRTPAEGKYQIAVGGNALVRNTEYNNATFSTSVQKVDAINIVTPADQGVNATFVIGSKDYTSNGVTKTMDTAPYIDGSGRTMMPVRYVADAMGISEDQVTWTQSAQTAMIFGKNTVAVKVGSNVITSNGTPITMDTVAVNNNGRVFVPVRFVANALGASVSWDNDKRMVTVYTVK